MNGESRYRLQAFDGRFASYHLGPMRVSLAGEETAYVFGQHADAQSAAEAFGKQLSEHLSVVEYPAIRGVFRVGDRVKFLTPQTADEQIERFEVLELRGDRALVRFLDSGMQIAPTFVHGLEELDLA
jgi:hypothetical protein